MSQPRPSLRILIVDDDADVRTVLAEFLRLRGHEVQVAGGGREGMELLHKHGPPSVAVVDWTMPGIDGRRFVEQLKAEAPGTFAVVITGENSSVLRPHRHHVGWDAHLQKPFSMRALEKVIFDLLGHGDR